jgi:hypothetical protein
MSAGAERFIANSDFLAALAGGFLRRLTFDLGNGDSFRGATKKYHVCRRPACSIRPDFLRGSRPFLCKDVDAMNPVNRLTIAAVACTAVAATACQSIRSSDPDPPPAPRVYVPRAATPAEEITLIRADSEVFAAVVRAQLGAGRDDYPYRIDELRYDPRPYGSRNGYPELGAGVQGAAPELYFARAGQDAIDQIRENRKLILEHRGVPEGSPFNYPQCAGVRVPKPPPSRRGSSRPKVTNVHAGCPKKPESYVTVGLPLRGQPEGLKKVRDTHGDYVDLGGDVWTTLVDEYFAGPSGWSHTQHAWIFKRSRWTGRLDLAATIQTGIVE